MRSRRDDVDPHLAVERALRIGVCGMGEATDERAERRLQRFAAVPTGAFVWTRDADGLTYLGRLTGEERRDDDPEAITADLVHVRDCTWLTDPVPDAQVPPAVAHTFARGGRNFQQIHQIDVGAQTEAVWAGQHE
jgi:hypothetical protein